MSTQYSEVSMKEIVESSVQPAKLTYLAPWVSESYIKIKINLNFYFHTSLWTL